MAFCKKCGARQDPGTVFCPSCGTKVGAPVAAARPSAPAARPAAPAARPAPAAAPRPMTAPMPGGKSKLPLILGITIPIVVVVVVLVLAIALGWFGGGGGGAMKDCGDNIACLQDAAKDCSPAKAEIKQGAITTTSEIRGKNGDNCEAYMRISGSGGLMDGDMTCNVPMSKMAIASTSPATLSQYCTGSLADKLSGLSGY